MTCSVWLHQGEYRRLDQVHTYAKLTKRLSPMTDKEDEAPSLLSSLPHPLFYHTAESLPRLMSCHRRHGANVHSRIQHVTDERSSHIMRTQGLHSCILGTPLDPGIDSLVSHFRIRDQLPALYEKTRTGNPKNLPWWRDSLGGHHPHRCSRTESYLSCPCPA